MKPYGQGSKNHTACVQGHSKCAICRPITHKQARKFGLLDYSERTVSRAKEKREARRIIAEHLAQ